MIIRNRLSFTLFERIRFSTILISVIGFRGYLYGPFFFNSAPVSSYFRLVGWPVFLPRHCIILAMISFNLNLLGFLWIPFSAPCAGRFLKTMRWGNFRIFLFSQGLMFFIAWCPVPQKLWFHIFCPFFFTVSAVMVNSAPDIISWSKGNI